MSNRPQRKQKKTVIFSPSDNEPVPASLRRSKRVKKQTEEISNKPSASTNHASTTSLVNNTITSPSAVKIPTRNLNSETCPCEHILIDQTQWVVCNTCSQWWHFQCTGLPVSFLALLETNEDIAYHTSAFSARLIA